MLLENVRLIKLTTSDDLLAEVIEESSSTIVVNFPLKIVPMPSRGGDGFSIGMMKWDVFLDYDSPMHLNKFTVVAMGPVGPDVKTSYFQAFQKYNSLKASREDDSNLPELEDLEDSITSSFNRTLH